MHMNLKPGYAHDWPGKTYFLLIHDELWFDVNSFKMC